jgi:4-hydroxysphinganine ceramide fatty acyl 2-hydroxylase
MQPLATFIKADLAADRQRCLVTQDTRVYDVTSFLPDHPGGADLIEAFRGKDVKDIMADEVSHAHSDAAYEMLQELLVGILAPTPPASLAGSETTVRGDVYATGLSCEEDLNVPTNVEADYARFKFLDLSRPLLPQVFCGGFSKAFYMEQVHRPRHYPHGSAPIMPYTWMEPLSKTPWWVVPTLWTPGVAYGVYVASQGLSTP